MRTTKKSKKKSRAKKPESEKLIQRKILKWLSTTGLLYWRQNSGFTFIGKRRIVLGAAGLPDIIVVIPPDGRLLGLEVKSAKGKMRPSQERFRDSLAAAGGGYEVVRTMEQAKGAIEFFREFHRGYSIT